MADITVINEVKLSLTEEDVNALNVAYATLYGIKFDLIDNEVPDDDEIYCNVERAMWEIDSVIKNAGKELISM